jgi:GTP-binding protein Era
LLGEKVADCIQQAADERNRFSILTKDEKQYVFIDTPDCTSEEPARRLYDKRSEAPPRMQNFVMFVIEAGVPLNRGAESAFRLHDSKANVLLIINKIDKVNKADLAKQIAEVSEKYSFYAIIPISALNNDGLDIIFTELDPLLTESPHFFPDDISTDQPERQIVAEIIREKILRLTEDEIPHGVAVVIEEFKEKKDLISVRAEIFCEKEGHKRIIIGKNGEMLKKIGTYAREDCEKLFGIRMYLDLWVKIKENWRDRPALLSNFGYNANDTINRCETTVRYF